MMMMMIIITTIFMIIIIIILVSTVSKIQASLRLVRRSRYCGLSGCVGAAVVITSFALARLNTGLPNCRRVQPVERWRRDDRAGLPRKIERKKESQFNICIVCGVEE